MNTEQLIREEAERRYKTNKDQRNVEFRVFELHRDRREVFIDGATFGASLNGWVKCNDRYPTELDADDKGLVIFYNKEFETYDILSYQYSEYDKNLTHWRKIVKP